MISLKTLLGIFVGMSPSAALQMSKTAQRSNHQANWTHLAGLAPHCEDWCGGDHLDHLEWGHKCEWNACHECSECSGETIKCRSVCATMEGTWHKKCQTLENCVGCDECQDPAFTNCTHWCFEVGGNLNDVCTWDGCTGCEACTPTPDPTPEPTPDPTPTCDAATCAVFEDPHVSVFDGAQVSLLTVGTSTTSRSDETVGDHWLVKSNLVSIQAKFMEDARLPDRNSFVRAIAVGGTFMKGNTIVIGSLEDNSTFNGQQILEQPDSSFEVDDGDFFVKAKRGSNSLLVEDLSKANRGVTLELPSGVNLILNRLHHHVNIAIKMCPQEGGQDGLCGNLNGFAADDTLELSTRRFEMKVSPEESLFKNLVFE